MVLVPKIDLLFAVSPLVFNPSHSTHPSDYEDCCSFRAVVVYDSLGLLDAQHLYGSTFTRHALTIGYARSEMESFRMRCWSSSI
jgi:hypothetical protein